MSAPRPLGVRDAVRLYWWTRARLLERGHAWEDVRALTPAETAQRWVEIRKVGLAIDARPGREGAKRYVRTLEEIRREAERVARVADEILKGE
jgi:hypothetical protein